jgi:hypothetical protein
MNEFMRTAWKLEKLHFISSPPSERVLERVFTGRQKEMATISSAIVDAPRRLLVKGLFGAGKTATLREIARRLTSEPARVLVVDEMLFESDVTIAHVLLRGLARNLAEESDYAKLLNSRLAGIEEELGEKAAQKDRIKSGIPKFLESGISDEEERKRTISLHSIPDPISAVRRLIADAVNALPERRIILFIDDLDKRDPENVRKLLVGCRELIHNPECSFVFTGHPLGILRDAYSSAGGIIDREVEVPRMDRDTMRLMVARYLGAGRPKTFFRDPEFKGSRVDPDDILPFSEESLDFIIKKSLGLPRVLNIICFNILMEARSLELRQIGLSELRMCWDACADQLRNGIRPDLRDTLELMLQREDPLNLEDLPDTWFDRLEVERHEQLMNRIDYALKRDLLITADGQHMVVNSLLRRFDEGPGLR